ncbi:MAG: hypothetical protein JWO36_1085 [Myxococcales bacterium]|nr:hypothetical protein [Myxococcales bacterium]
MSEQALPPELEELLDAERAVAPATASLRIAVRARVTASVGHAPLGHSLAGAALGGVGKVIAVVAIVVGVGGTVALIHRRGSEDGETRASKPSAGPVIPSPTPVAPSLDPLTSTRAEPSTRAGSGTHVATVPRSTRPEPVHSPIAQSLPSQAELLREAWAAVSRGEAARALDLADQDEHSHPSGALDEERAALRIVALAKLERRDEARTAASLFLTDHPDSVHRALIERTIASKQSP